MLTEADPAQSKPSQIDGWKMVESAGQQELLCPECAGKKQPQLLTERRR